MQVDVFLNHLAQLVNTDKQKQQQQLHGISREIFVDSSVVGLIIGQGGNNLKRIQELYNVSISIEKGSKEYANRRKVIVQGSTLEDIEAALLEINLHKEYIPINHEHIDHVCGRNDENLDYFLRKSGLIQLDVEQQANGSYSIMAIGTSQSIEDLKDILHSHLEYFHTYR